jgi:hypothetical protein
LSRFLPTKKNPSTANPYRMTKETPRTNPYFMTESNPRAKPSFLSSTPLKWPTDTLCRMPSVTLLPLWWVTSFASSCPTRVSRARRSPVTSTAPPRLARTLPFSLDLSARARSRTTAFILMMSRLGTWRKDTCISTVSNSFSYFTRQCNVETNRNYRC